MWKRLGWAGTASALFAFAMFASPMSVDAGDAADVDAEISRLGGDDATSCAAAVDALVAMGAKAVSPLAAALASSPIPKRIDALDALGRIAADHDEAVAPLLASLGDKEATIRAAAARGLLAAGPRAKSADSALKAALTDNFVAVRMAAQAAVIRLDGSAPNAVPPLLAEMEDADATVRIAAMRTLLALGVRDSRVVEALGRAANSPDPFERSEALVAIPRLSDDPVPEVTRVGGWLRGDRLKRRPSAKPDPAVESAVAAALDWLARHQSASGVWSCAAFDARCAGERCDGAGYPQFDVGVTGLALLCFLGAGETNVRGAHKDEVARGLAFLRGAVGKDGSMLANAGVREYAHVGADARTDGCMYDQALGTLALCDAYMITGHPGYGDPAKRAVEFVLKAKSADVGWRYEFPPSGDCDTSVTGWMTYVLATAHGAGLVDAPAAIEDACSWVESMTRTDTGRTGYQFRGDPPSRFAPTEPSSGPKFPPERSESLTAVGAMVRLFAGHAPKTDKLLTKGFDLVAKTPPVWSDDAGSVDFCYWFWGSTCLRQAGGRQWASWISALNAALLPTQYKRDDGCRAGSWDPVDAWSVPGGRVYATAMCCLCLESQFRMDSVLDAK